MTTTMTTMTAMTAMMMTTMIIIIEQRVQKFNNGRARINYSLTIFSARVVGRVKMLCTAAVLRRQ